MSDREGWEALLHALRESGVKELYPEHLRIVDEGSDETNRPVRYCAVGAILPEDVISRAKEQVATPEELNQVTWATRQRFTCDAYQEFFDTRRVTVQQVTSLMTYNDSLSDVSPEERYRYVVSYLEEMIRKETLAESNSQVS